MKKNDKEFKEAFLSLERRINEISSPDGIFTIKYNGTGEFIDCKINGRIEEIDQAELEKSIIECLRLQKKQVSEGVFNMLVDLAEENKNDDKDEKLEVTIDNVS